jgi:hypothetical protein
MLVTSIMFVSVSLFLFAPIYHQIHLLNSPALYQLRTVENRRSISRSASPIPGSSSDESKSPSGGLGDELAPRVYEPPWGELDDDGEEVFWDGYVALTILSLYTTILTIALPV